VIPIAVCRRSDIRARRAAAAELADWMESPEGKASSLEAIGRACRSANTAAPARGVAGPRSEEALKGLRACRGSRGSRMFSASTPQAVTNGKGGQWPVWAQHRKRQKPVPARRGFASEREGRRAESRRSGILGARADPRRLARYGTTDKTRNVTIFAIQIAMGECSSTKAPKPPRFVANRWASPRRPTSPAGLSLPTPPAVICSRSH